MNKCIINSQQAAPLIHFTWDANGSHTFIKVLSSCTANNKEKKLLITFFSNLPHMRGNKQSFDQ